MNDKEFSSLEEKIKAAKQQEFLVAQQRAQQAVNQKHSQSGQEFSDVASHRSKTSTSSHVSQLTSNTNTNSHSTKLLSPMPATNLYVNTSDNNNNSTNSNILQYSPYNIGTLKRKTESSMAHSNGSSHSSNVMGTDIGKNVFHPKKRHKIEPVAPQQNLKKLQPLIPKPVSNIMPMPVQYSPKSSVSSVTGQLTKQQPNIGHMVPHKISSLSGNETFKQELKKLGLLNFHDIVWSGDIVFKGKPTAVDFHYLKGNKNLVKIFLNYTCVGSNSLNLLNRMKLDMPGIKELFTKLSTDNIFLNTNAAILLAVANIPDSSLNDGQAIRQIEDHLKVQLVNYFKEKNACGVVSSPKAQLYLFSRDCDFSEQMLVLHGGKMLDYLKGSEYPYLMVVFTDLT